MAWTCMHLKHSVSTWEPFQLHAVKLPQDFKHIIYQPLFRC